MENTINNYRINDQFEQTDLNFVHRELAKSYWSKNIAFETVKKSSENSLCFNAFLGNEQIAFARVITDKTSFAYLCDVIVTESFRGKGIGKTLMAFIMKHPDLQGLRRFTLATKDAHGLYAQFGFTALKFPDRQMEINVREIYDF
ncbi:MAG: GNAT family N-acetyltransferase [Bacteroidetes bacterium]|jgi:GNAT superfamily N-acetyltransferase|nr:GNAT family N-acetyltransferase [Bacteroidota bacterium]